MLGRPKNGRETTGTNYEAFGLDNVRTDTLNGLRIDQQSLEKGFAVVAITAQIAQHETDDSGESGVGMLGCQSLDRNASSRQSSQQDSVGDRQSLERTASLVERVEGRFEFRRCCR